MPFGERWGERTGHPPRASPGEAGRRTLSQECGFWRQAIAGVWGDRGWGGLIPRSESSSELLAVTLGQDLDLSGALSLPREVGGLSQSPGLWMSQGVVCAHPTSLPPSSPGGMGPAHTQVRDQALQLGRAPSPGRKGRGETECRRRQSRASGGETEAKSLWTVGSKKGPRCRGPDPRKPLGVVARRRQGSRGPGFGLGPEQAFFLSGPRELPSSFLHPPRLRCQVWGPGGGEVGADCQVGDSRNLASSIPGLGEAAKEGLSPRLLPRRALQRLDLPLPLWPHSHWTDGKVEVERRL